MSTKNRSEFGNAFYWIENRSKFRTLRRSEYLCDL